MAIKDMTQTLLKRLEEGTEQIYSNYRARIKQAQKKYSLAQDQVDREYQNLANQASAQAKIQLKNTMEKMADAGYVSSGETVQATIASNANRSAALSDLAVQKAEDSARLELKKAREEADLQSEAEEKAESLKQGTLETIRQQENLDREHQALEEQRAFDNALATEKWEWEKQQAAKEEEKAAAAEQTEVGLVPKIDPYTYLSDIVEKNTRESTQGGYKVVDRKAILQAINDVVKDTYLARSYRYEFYLYAKSMGYLNVE